MKKSKIILIVIALSIIAIVVTLFVSYIKIKGEERNCKNTLTELEEVFQKRTDIIPDFINVITGYTSHEDDVIKKVIEAKNNTINTNNIDEKIEKNNEFTNSLKELMNVMENYPDLKATENFTKMSNQLTEIENNMNSKIEEYNNNVDKYNDTIKKFPNDVLVKLFNYKDKEHIESTSNNE